MAWAHGFHPVTGYTALVNLAHLTPSDTVFLARVHNWLIATWALSIATQLGATLLISYRFWKTIRWTTSKGLRTSRLSILWILVESGALYSITTVFLLGFSDTNTGAIFAASLGQISVCRLSIFFSLVSDVVLQALAPTLIIVRAGLKSSGSSSSFTPAKGSISNPYYSSQPPQPSTRDMESGRGEGDPMVVHIKKATEIHLENMKPVSIASNNPAESWPNKSCFAIARRD